MLGWAGLIMLLLAQMLLTQFVLPERVAPGVLDEVLRPAMWLAIALLAGVLVILDESTRVRTDWVVVKFAALWACVQGLVWLGAGLVTGYGDRLADLSLVSLVGNTALLFVAVLGAEAARSYLVGAPGARRLEVAIVVPALVLAFVELVRLGVSSDAKGTLVVALPLLMQGMATALFAFLGGFPAALAYRGIVEGLRWLLPVYPDLTPEVAAAIATVLPIIGMVVAERLFPQRLPAREAAPAPARSHDRSLRWATVIAVVAVTLIWAVIVGFGVRPIALGADALQPKLHPGDIALMRPVSAGAVRPGDIVSVASIADGRLQRVTTVETMPSGRLRIITMGTDAAGESTMWPTDRASKLVLVVPKAGWISIGLRRIGDWLMQPATGG